MDNLLHKLVDNFELNLGDDVSDKFVDNLVDNFKVNFTDNL